MNVYPTKIPKFPKWWNKTFRSKDGYYNWADRYAEKHPDAANTLIINPDEHTITNTRDNEYSPVEQFQPVEQPDIIDSEGSVIYPLDFPVPPENSFFYPMNVRPWNDKTVIDAYNQWKEDEKRAYRQKLAEEEARIIEEYGYPLCDKDGNIIGFSQTPLPQEKPLSGTDPIGEFYVVGEVLGPLFNLAGKGWKYIKSLPSKNRIASDAVEQAPFKSELDWSPNNWLGKRADGVYDAEDVAALKSHVPEYIEIEKTTKANGTWLKMPDGSTWKGDPRSWV